MRLSSRTLKRLALAVVFAALVAAYFALDLNRYLSLDELKASRDALVEYYRANPLAVLGAYFGLYVVVIVLALPAAGVLSLGGGALFGFWTGLVLVSFASSLAALLSFLLSRFLFRAWVERRFPRVMERAARGVEREGAFYLFTLRLIPVFPFFVINLVMGLTRMRAWTFYWVTQVGALPGTAVFVNAGVQLGQVESVGDVLSWDVILSLVLLGVFPLAVKRIVAFVRARSGHKEMP